MKKALGLVAATAVVLSVGWMLLGQTPASESGHAPIVVRGYPTGWYRMTIPDGWFFYDHVASREISSVDIESANEDTKRVKLEIWDVGDYDVLDVLESTEYTTSTIMIDGYSGTKVTSVPAQVGDLVAASTVYKIEVNPSLQEEDFFISSHIINYDDESELSQLRQLVDAVVSGIDFLPNYADGTAKAVTSNPVSQIPNVAGYDINHPSMWVVSEGMTQSTIAVQGQAHSGQLTISIQPGVEQSLWDTGERIPRSEAVLRYGQNGVRRIGGRLLTEYILGTGAQPSLVSVDAPDLADNSVGYWTNEMLVWYVLYGTDIRYGGASPPPYPAP